MKIDFSFSDKMLKIDNEFLEFKYDIRDVKQIDNLLIVLIGVPFGENYLDNLFAVNIHGQIAWQVKSNKGIALEKNRLPYENMMIDESNQIIVSDFYGRRYFVNPVTGEILARSVAK